MFRFVSERHRRFHKTVSLDYFRHYQFSLKPFPRRVRMISMVNLELELHLRFLRYRSAIKLPCHLRIRHQRPKHVEDGLYGTVPALVHLGWDSALDHLPQDVALLVNPHQSPAVDLALDFSDAPLHIGPVIKFVAQCARIGDMRAEFGVGGLAVHVLRNEPCKAFVKAVFKAGHNWFS